MPVLNHSSSPVFGRPCSRRWAPALPGSVGCPARAAPPASWVGQALPSCCQGSSALSLGPRLGELVWGGGPQELDRGGVQGRLEGGEALRTIPSLQDESFRGRWHLRKESLFPKGPSWHLKIWAPSPGGMPPYPPVARGLVVGSAGFQCNPCSSARPWGHHSTALWNAFAAYISWPEVTARGWVLRDFKPVPPTCSAAAVPLALHQGSPLFPTWPVSLGVSTLSWRGRASWAWMPTLPTPGPRVHRRPPAAGARLGPPAQLGLWEGQRGL